MNNKIYESVLSRLVLEVPLFAKVILDSAINKVGTNNENVSAVQLKNAIESYIEPAIRKKLGKHKGVHEIGAGTLTLDNNGKVVYAKGVGKIVSKIKNKFKIEEEITSEKIKIKDRTFKITIVPIFDRDGKITNGNCTVMDITLDIALDNEIYQSYDLLKKERDKAQRYLDLANVMFMMLDTKGNISMINKKGTDILSGNLSQMNNGQESKIIGKNWFENYIKKEDRTEIKKVFKKIVSGKLKGVEQYENEIINEKGEKILISWHNTIVYDDGKIIGILSSGEDITELRKNQIESEQNHKIYEILFENTFDAIFVADAKSGKIIECNKAATELLDCNKNEIIGVNQTKLHPKDKVKQYMKLFQEHVNAGKKEGVVAEVVTKKGKIVPVEISATVTEIQGKKVIHGIFKNITKRIQKENVVETNNKLIENIIDNNAIPTFVINSNHRITHWNKACEKLTGLKKEEMIGTNKQWMAFYPKKRVVMADLVIEKADEKILKKFYDDKYLKSKIAERLYQASDYFPNLKKWLFFTAKELKDDEGNIIAAIETLQDITLNKEVEIKEKESLELLHKIMDNIVTGVLLINKDTHKIEYVNPYAEKLIGLSFDKITGKSCHNFIRPNIKGKCPITDLGKKIDLKETVLFSKDKKCQKENKNIPILKSVIPIIINEKEFLLESFVDLTESVKTKQELNEKIMLLQKFKDSTVDQVLRLKEIEDENIKLKRMLKVKS